MAGQQSRQLLAYIYHERQEQGSMLCAQHALNGVLQDHCFDASQLAQIAEELAEYERAELGMNADQDATAASSNHMDDTGFFSVEVLSRAFKTWDMNLVRWREQGMQERYAHPEQEFAFVLNLGSHWIAVRGFGRIHRQWYNLNSFFAKPQWLGDAYLGTFLHAAAQEGYSIFAVEQEPNAAPLENLADAMADTLANGMQEQPIIISDEEDAELQEALRLSRNDAQNQSQSEPVSLTPQRRRTRDTSSSGEEVDRHIDEIAPSRHRPRNEKLTASVEEMPISGHRSRRRSQSIVQPESSNDLNGMRKPRSRKNSRKLSTNNIEPELVSTHTQRSPFLAREASDSSFNSDVQVISNSESEIDQEPQATWVDEEDQQLQAVIAASLGQAYEASQDLNTSKPTSQSQSVPEDVERIRRMREAAKNASGHDGSNAERVQSDPPPEEEPNESEDLSEGETPLLSPEEMRKLRLARFG
ncbi:hypothetical protein MYAM1_002347 [Malassezia yamatoensis]|uniref:ubiquitinyl hydrolase 1 n=1 Tax=Malassezia yamatoensis TaxID=253288 RepID=A0AAJ5YTQ0_9BASI|nr:hypothetical protein MYAM1_002347 [Malassezia yamatoensis]